MFSRVFWGPSRGPLATELDSDSALCPDDPRATDSALPSRQIVRGSFAATVASTDVISGGAMHYGKRLGGAVIYRTSFIGRKPIDGRRISEG